MKRVAVIYLNEVPKRICRSFKIAGWDVDLLNVDELTSSENLDAKVVLICLGEAFNFSLGIIRFIKLSFNKPIVVLDSGFTPERKDKCVNAGADLYLCQPIDAKDVCKYVSFCSVKSEEYVKIVRYKDIILDLSRRTVTRGDKTFYLRNKEFELLKLFVENPGIVMSKTKILENVWDMNAITATTTVESHISTLRKKIDKDFNEQRLHTIYCVGYKIE